MANRGSGSKKRRQLQIKPPRLPCPKETGLFLGHQQIMNTKRYSTRVGAPVFPRVKGGVASPRQSRTLASDLKASTKIMTGTIQTSSGDDRTSMAAPPRTHKSCTSNSRNRLDVRTCIRIATWNVLTLNHTGYVSALVCQLKKRRIMLAGITEARLTGDGSVVVEGATVLHSGGI